MKKRRTLANAGANILQGTDQVVPNNSSTVRRVKLNDTVHMTYIIHLGDLANGLRVAS